MSQVSSFYGIAITMHYGDHAPPHFHVRHGGDEAKVAIADGRLLAGSLSRRPAQHLREWLSRRRPELEANWRLMVENKQPKWIEPLR